MRYWLYDERTKSVLGPHLAMVLPKQSGFGPESKVAPDGARGSKDWKAAKDVDELKSLFPPPSPPPEQKKPG